MPAIAVKPDGTKLLVTWYDRRNSVNNSDIEFYGRWFTINSDGTLSYGTEFKISTSSFPPVFSGTLKTSQGTYDPVYPAEQVDLSWWYYDWPTGGKTVSSWRSHVGEYNGAWADANYAYATWTDNRVISSGRNQSDIRFVRITWP